MTLPFAVRVRATASSYWSTPPLTTVRLRVEAAVSIVTVQPFVIVTLSAPVGTTPPDHVEPELQSPPGATQEISTPSPTNGGVPNALPRRRSRLLGKDAAGVAAERAWAARAFGTATGRATAAFERCDAGRGLRYGHGLLRGGDWRRGAAALRPVRAVWARTLAAPS